jgi:hypothetical protein
MLCSQLENAQALDASQEEKIEIKIIIIRLMVQRMLHYYQ